MLFPMADYWWFYAGFLAFVGVMLALDLGVFHKKEHNVSFKEATIWSVIWVGLALLFSFGLYQYSLQKFSTEIATQLFWEFLTGYVIEYSLSIDNIFVFVLVFSYFAGLIAVLGIGMFALPTGILGASFVEEINKLKSKNTTVCPHCGEEIE